MDAAIKITIIHVVQLLLKMPEDHVRTVTTKYSEWLLHSISSVSVNTQIQSKLRGLKLLKASFANYDWHIYH